MLLEDKWRVVSGPKRNQGKREVVLNPFNDLGKPASIAKHTLQLSTADPAGEDEIALCNHNVTVKYNPTMAECHYASALANTVELELKEKALTLHVGEELPDASDDEA